MNDELKRKINSINDKIDIIQNDIKDIEELQKNEIITKINKFESELWEIKQKLNELDTEIKSK